MGRTAPIRLAKLRPESAERYPMLPARMWTTAAWLTELVASYRRPRPDRPVKTENGRILPESDFEFRGGFRRRIGGWFLRTRAGELRYSGSG